MKRVEKRKGKNQKDGEGRGETKELKRRGKNKYKQRREEEGRKSKRYQRQYEQNELKISCPSQEIPYQLKEQEVAESIRTELTQDLIPSKEILYQLLQLNFGQLHLKRLHEKSRQEKGKESEGWRR